MKQPKQQSLADQIRSRALRDGYAKGYYAGLRAGKNGSERRMVKGVKQRGKETTRKEQRSS